MTDLGSEKYDQGSQERKDYEEHRNKSYKTWAGKGHTLNGFPPYGAAWDIVQQATSEGVCKPDMPSQEGYYLGAGRALSDDPLEGVDTVDF